jgi:hypothetical protein
MAPAPLVDSIFLGLHSAAANVKLLTMTIEETQQIKELVLRELPAVLEQDPNFALFIEGILSEKFPRRDEFARMLDELQSFRKETTDHFAQVDQWLEKVDQRFEQIHTELNDIRQEIAGLRDWMEVNVGGFQSRAGKRLEDVVAGAFCYGLKRQDIRPEQVRLRQTVTDHDGVVFKAGKTREIDIIVQDGRIIVFEVKSTADLDDIEDLADKAKLMQHLHPGQMVEGVLVMLAAEAEHRKLCAERGLRLIP